MKKYLCTHKNIIRVLVLALFMFQCFNSFSQTMTRQDKLLIQQGIKFQSWVRNDHANEQVPVPARQPLVVNRSGRYVRVQLSNTEVLSLAEVQVFSNGVNIALSKTTQQSSNKSGGGGLSDAAVDGNTDGNFANGSVTHTLEGYAQMEPWWQVDLGSTATIDSIVLWNRTDCCGSRLKGFYVFVSDVPLTSSMLLGSLTQSGVSNYVQPLTGFAPRFPPASELSYAHISPMYFEIPNYNYTVYQQDTTLYWGIAKGAKPAFPAGAIVRSPSSFEQANGFLNSVQAANVGKLHSICIGDEEPYSTTMTSYMKGWFDVIRAKYPDVLFHSNQYINEWNASQMSTYMQTAQPDLITFDMYYYHYIYGPSPGAGNTYTRLYQDMQVYRNYALGGYDGTGTAPICFGGYLQAFSGDNPSYPGYRVSESEFNLNAFTYLTMGAKWINEWLYYAFFWDNVTQQPTPQYYQVANIGKQVVNLSPHLSRLRTTDLRFIPGQNSGGTNASPNNIVQWDANVDPYVKNIVATNLGTYNSGLKGDVLAGYFKPVPGLDNTPGITMAPVPATYNSYFMLLNGLTKPNGPGITNCDGTNPACDTVQGKANLTAQKITLTIDFGIDPVDTLYRVRRSDGVVEMVPLTLVSGSQYSMSDTLDGGHADLFYWKNQGKPLPAPTSGTSLQFSSGSVSAGNVPALSGASKFTLEAWVKFNSTTPWSSVFYRNGSGTNRIVLSTGTNNSLHVVVSNGVTNYANSANNVISPNQWYHVAMVYDGTQSTDAAKLKLYINGQQRTLTFGGGTVPATTGTTTAPMVIGAIDQGTGGNYLNGVVDEVRVWNEALSQTTISGWKNKTIGACHPNVANLQVYWQLDDSTNPAVATASMGTAYTGSIVNGTYVTGGWATNSSGCASSGKSLQFSSGSVSAGNVTALNTASKFTMEAWVKFNTTAAWKHIFSKTLSGTNRIALATNNVNSLQVVVDNGGTNYANAPNNLLTPNQWYHVAMVYDGTRATDSARLKLFVNGIQQTLTFGGGSVPATTGTNSSPYLIGTKDLTSTVNYLDGIMDEVRVWNEALSQQTLTAWKDKVLGSCHPNAANLQVYWQLDDNTNPAVATASLGTAYTGSIVNATYITGGQATGSSGCLGARVANNLTVIANPNTIEVKTDLSKVYPNPVPKGEGFNIDIQSSETANTTVTVFDVMGRSVYNINKRVEKGLNRIYIDLSCQASGVYIVQVKSSKQTKQYKVIKN